MASRGCGLQRKCEPARAPENERPRRRRRRTRHDEDGRATAVATSVRPMATHCTVPPAGASTLALQGRKGRALAVATQQGVQRSASSGSTGSALHMRVHALGDALHDWHDERCHTRSALEAVVGERCRLRPGLSAQRHNEPGRKDAAMPKMTVAAVAAPRCAARKGSAPDALGVRVRD
jgi:hypothetical protein